MPKNILDKLSVQDALKLAKLRKKAGSEFEAKKIYQEILRKRPNNLKAKTALNAFENTIDEKTPEGKDIRGAKIQSLMTLCSHGKFKDVLAQGTRLINMYPSSVEIYNILGVASRGLGESKRAADYFRKSMMLDPDYVQCINNLGIVLQDQCKLDDAITTFKKAIALQPDYAPAYKNLGNVLSDKKMYSEAIKFLNKALTLKPNDPGTYNNLGNSQQGLGNFKKAIEAYSHAIKLKPNYAEAYFNLAIALKTQERSEEAIAAYVKAIENQPSYTAAYNNLNNLLSQVKFEKPYRHLHEPLIYILDNKICRRPKDIANAITSLLNLETAVQRASQVAARGDFALSPVSIILELKNLPLLQKLMSVCPIPDIKLEKLFRYLRSSILHHVSLNRYVCEELLEFQSTLALQCFTNEYIYNQTDTEDKILNDLQNKVNFDLSKNQQPPAQVILALASYKALNEYPWSSALVITEEVKDVYIRQVEEPNTEEEIKLRLPELEKIQNLISSSVRAQYEDNPYPRWVNLGFNPEGISIAHLRQHFKLSMAESDVLEVKKPSILIAGCGTGQHSISTAARFKDARVTAVDLSLSSLAYAKRKTEQLNIQNIEYLQADLLDLSKLDKQFDVIESVGVLHHMEVPLEGWKTLVGRLKMGGIMKIGLYSEMARHDIIKIRKEITDSGIQASSHEIKAFRNLIMMSNEQHHKRIQKSSDFYSLSAVRDLLFHVQEHRFSIPMIQEYLNKLGLQFCGFESPQIVSSFQKENPQVIDLYDLSKWNVFEEVNRTIFAGMYQFWCQKITETNL